MQMFAIGGSGIAAAQKSIKTTTIAID